jgi:hypothetical protein
VKAKAKAKRPFLKRKLLSLLPIAKQNIGRIKHILMLILIMIAAQMERNALMYSFFFRSRHRVDFASLRWLLYRDT